jgi:surface protein
MKFYLINNVSGNSSCQFNVYYDSINVSNLASIYGPSTPYSPASNLTFSQVSSGNLVVTVPDGAGSIIISDNCGCPPVTNIFPSPTPTITPTITPTKTTTPTNTLTRTQTRTQTPTKTATPKNTPTTTPTLTRTQTPTLTQTKTPTPTKTPAVCPEPFIGRAFISVWRTTTINEIIELPYNPSGTYVGSINWGDGTSSINSYTNRTHTYATPGNYTITITGLVLGWGYNPVPAPWRTQIIEIRQWGDSLRLSNTGAQFQGCSNLVFTTTDELNVSCLSNFNFMFEDCSSFTGMYGIESWNTSNARSMRNTFSNAILFNRNINNWDVSKVSSMNSTFYKARSFNQPLNNWNVSGVTNMSSMFAQAESFNQNINNWNVSRLTDTNGLFLGARSFNQPLNNWNVSRVSDMNGTFFNATNFNQNINNWDVSNVRTAYSMFYFATSFNQPLNNWNVSNITNMGLMFRAASSFNQPLSNWNVSNVTTMLAMFQGATSFNQDISSWNPINVTDFRDFMNQKTSSNYNSTFYNALLNSWSTKNLRSNITIDFGTIKYTFAGLPGRVALFNNFNWTITDGGQI